MSKQMSTKISINDFPDEDFIDIELTSSPKSKDFSFQIQISSPSINSYHTTSITSSADELFFNGRLLPLYHIPPRRQVHLITEPLLEEDDNYFTIPFNITCSSAPCTNTNTPRNISPTESCRESCELHPDDEHEQHFVQWSSDLTQLSGLIKKKRLWSKRVKLIKHLKASKSYLKSLFRKSLNSDESTRSEMGEDAYLKIGKDCPTIGSIMKNIEKENGMIVDESNVVQRRSFSSAIKRHSPVKCLSSSSSGGSSSSSSSSSSLNSNGSGDLQLFRRSISTTEIEGSIEAAIAHCKRSHKSLDLEENQKR